MNRFVLQSIFLVFAAITALSAHSEVKIGVVYTATGPGASIGIPQQRMMAILPISLGGERIVFTALDDGSDGTTAVKNVKKLTTEREIDVLLGPSLSTSSVAVREAVAESRTPMISFAGASAIVEPVDEKRHWVFKTAQNDTLMASIIVKHMADSGIKTVGYIGLSDGYGEGWWLAFSKLAESHKIAVVASERFERTDTSVTGQILKLIAAKPDAVFVAAFGTPAALPHTALVDRGFKGAIYQTHGVANSDFLRIGGKKVEGTFVPVGPVMVAEQLPPSNPIRKQAMDFIAKYEAIPGAGARSTFAAHFWDALKILDKAIPVAMKTSKPGTPEFRKALRDAIENVREVVGSNGVFNMSKTDHVGLDERARVMAQIRDGKWMLVQ